MERRTRMRTVLSVLLGLALVLSNLNVSGLAYALDDDAESTAAEQLADTSTATEAAADEAADETEATDASDAQETKDDAQATVVESEAEVTAADETEEDATESSDQETTDAESTANAVRAGPLRAPAANDAAKEVTATVTNFEIQNLSGQTTDRVFYTDRFYLAMDWDASANGADLHEGDYFVITLPDEMVFPSESPATDFNVYASDGTTVIATAHIDAGASGGGTVTVTFTEWVEGKENVNGSIRLAAQFDREDVTLNEENTFSISVNGEVVPTTITVTGPKELENEDLAKWGQATGSSNEAQWYVRINHSKKTLTNVVISDYLSGGTGDETYIADSFVLTRIEMDEYGDTVQTYETIDLSDKLTIAADGKSFTLNLGDVNGDQYRLGYRTTYTAGTTLRNNVTLTSTEEEKTYSATHISADSGGSGTGTLANKIKIIKLDAEDGETPIKGAVFRVTAPNGNTFTLTTGDDGTITSGTLTSGLYKAQEIEAPNGYVIDDTVHDLVVSPDGGAVLYAINRPVSIDVKVTKEWVGPTGGPVTVHLLADGNDTGKTLTLSADNNWTGSFEGLRQFAPGTDGVKITYTVREDPVANYDPEVTGDADSGFTITNVNNETVSIPVTKAWDDDDNRDGVRPDSITVELYAQGDPTGITITLTAANGWTGSFDGLARYDADGNEIAYTVKETNAPAGYTIAGTEGTVSTGITITNAHTPEETSVPVTKRWVGPAGGPVTVHLLADGTDTGQTLTLSEDNNWSGTFTGLKKYRDGGTLIVYTVSEDPVAGYSTGIAGDATGGFTVTNTNDETIALAGSKTWDDDENRDGVRPESITIRLLADGTEVANATVTAADNWAWSFTGLRRYDATDGHEIVYTVTEDAVPDYSTDYDGLNVTNTHTPGKTSVTVTKAWDDANDQDGIRPDTITVELYANDVATGKKLTLSAENNWMGSFTDLNQKEAGVDIAYTVKEVGEPSGYKVKVTGDATTGFTVTNTHTPEKTSIDVTKVWDDDDDADGIRPDSVTVRLLADGTPTGKTLTLSADNNWSGSFKDLDVYANGKKITYTVEEVGVPSGYEVEVTGDAESGFDVTNTHEPEKPGPKKPKPNKPNKKKSRKRALVRTGDGTSLAVAGALAAGGAACVGAALTLRARKRNEEGGAQ